MKFAIVILTYNNPEFTAECIRSILAVKPRQFPDKQIFIVHNGSDAAIVDDLRQRYPRFYHVVLKENEGFSVGANAGIAAAFPVQPWVLFLTQDTSLVHFPESPPFEPCLSAVKIYKRSTERIGSVGGAVDVGIAKNYLCPKSDLFWNSFESPILAPYVPRTAFWIHQQCFEKVKGFDENLSTMWEDVDLSLRLRKEGEMLQLDEKTEILHHRKGQSRRDPLYAHYLYHRNRFMISRRLPREKFDRIKFEVGIFLEWMGILLTRFLAPTRSMYFYSYIDSWKYPPVQRFPAGQEKVEQTKKSEDKKTS